MEAKGSVLHFDDIMKLSIPAVRYALSFILKEKYNIRQQEIANKLGITQAAVNKYLNKKCSEEIVRLGGKIIKMKNADQVASRMIKAKKPGERNNMIDKLASNKEILKLASGNLPV